MLTRSIRSIRLWLLASTLAIGGCGGHPPAVQTAKTDKPTVEKPGDENTALVSTDPSGKASNQPSSETPPTSAASQATEAEAGPQGSVVPPPALKPILVETKIVTDKYEDGKLKRQVAVNVYTGIPEQYEGEFKEWYPNGKLWKQGNYKEDKREGPWKFWHENGTLAKSGDYKAGHMEGGWNCQRADGTKSREEHWSAGRRDGVWKYYDATGSRLLQQQQYKQNTPEGTWTTWYPNGQKATEEIYME